MTDRYLTITLQPDWKSALRAMGAPSQTNQYQGEVLNFESPGHFFGQLTQKRWDLVRVAQGKGELTIRELARYVERDVKRVHEDIGILTNLGLLERAESGRVMCPYTSMHIDMYMKAALKSAPPSSPRWIWWPANRVPVALPASWNYCKRWPRK